MRRHWSVRGIAAAIVGLAVLTVPGVAAACPVCFGEASGPMAEGVNNGVVFMLAMVGVVQFGFVALFVGMWRRSKRYQERKDTFEILDGGMR